MLDTMPPIESESLTPIVPNPRPRASLALWLLGIVVIAIMAGVGYYRYSTFTPTSSPTPTPAPAQSLSGFSPMPDATSLLAYLKENNRDVFGDEEIVLINPATKKETLLLIKKASYAYKYYGSEYLFYFTQNNLGEYHRLNLQTGHDETFDLLDHGDARVDITLNVNAITDISPDGNYLVFNTSFSWPCPTMSPFPSGFQGGYGPCGPEESLDNPSGYYLYNFKTNQSTHLPVNTYRTSRWDIANAKLYFVDYDQSSTHALDLKSKTLTNIDTTGRFGYYTYPLVQKDQLVKFEGSTGDDNLGPFGKIYLINNSDHKETPIDSVNSWTDIQPFITASPGESDILYRRSTNIAGLHRNSIYRFNLESGKTSRLTKDDDSLSYSIYVSWLSDHEIVTSVDVIEPNNYNNQNQYLVKIDLNTLKEERLTNHDQVMYFNTQ